MLKLRWKFTATLLMVGVLALTIWPKSVWSQATAPTSGQGLEISPPVIELNADPGQTVTANIRLRNITKSDLLAKGQAEDFGASGEEGQPKILLDQAEETRYSLKFWVEALSEQRIVSQEAKNYAVKINVPQNAEPGGHYGVIRFTARPPEIEETGVALSASIGTLVLLRVSGEIKESLSVAEFFTSQYGKRGRFFEAMPIRLTERIKNDGTVHVKPSGQVEIVNWFGRKVGSLPVNQNPARNVLPDSIRKFEQDLDQGSLKRRWLLGRYEARLKLTYGQTNQTLSSTLVFWVIPWRLIILLLLLLVALYFLLRWLIRRYNRYIIERAKR